MIRELAWLRNLKRDTYFIIREMDFLTHSFGEKELDSYKDKIMGIAKEIKMLCFELANNVANNTQNENKEYLINLLVGGQYSREPDSILTEVITAEYDGFTLHKITESSDEIIQYEDFEVLYKEHIHGKEHQWVFSDDYRI